MQHCKAATLVLCQAVKLVTPPQDDARSRTFLVVGYSKADLKSVEAAKRDVLAGAPCSVASLCRGRALH